MYAISDGNIICEADTIEQVKSDALDFIADRMWFNNEEDSTAVQLLSDESGEYEKISDIEIEFSPKTGISIAWEGDYDKLFRKK